MLHTACERQLQAPKQVKFITTAKCELELMSRCCIETYRSMKGACKAVTDISQV